MKSPRTQLLCTLMLVFTIGLSAFTCFDQPVSFEGTWVLDITKSELGNTPVPKTGRSIIRVIQQQPLLIMEKSLEDSAGKVQSKIDTISFDGKAMKINVGNGQIIERLITQQWSADQQVMTLASKYTTDNNGEPIEFIGSEIWSLANSGKILIIVNETVLPDRTEKIKLVYIKQ